jgi:predicted phosphate transport protein (TIGR00153 family)
MARNILLENVATRYTPGTPAFGPMLPRQVSIFVSAFGGIAAALGRWSARQLLTRSGHRRFPGASPHQLPTAEMRQAAIGASSDVRKQGIRLSHNEASMLGWFQALMPKEERFFKLFEKHAAIVVAGAEALRGLLQGGNSIETYCKQVFQHEAEADEVTKQVLIAVRRTFITPFDRTDIQDLISSMDDAIDQMNKTAKTIVLFEVTAFALPMQQMSEIILQSSKLVLEAVPLLSSIGSNASRLNTLTAKLITIEEEADDIYNCGIKELFLASRAEGNQGSAMKFVVGSELYDHLEKVVDRFEDVANEINSIVVDQL